MAQKFLIHTDTRDVVLEYEATDDDGIRVRINEDGPWKTAGLEQVGDTGLFLLMIDNQPTELYLERRRGGASVTIGRHTFDFKVDRWRSAFENRDTEEAGATGTLKITAPMTGSIVDVQRSVGDPVETGDVLLIIESMKMDNELRTPGNGVVSAIHVKAGDRVTAGQLLAVVEA
ncbi:MAG: biotin/lipoyl-binding protein [Dehalococcoidia bacterium]|nr:biotin/lipoyl-binding protein [Dehalococcoidia bacterium]MCA9844674.1 biotin/lipoyl-binding protein [Dehalococcoidia bacterium]